MTEQANTLSPQLQRALWALPYAGMLYMFTGFLMILFPYAEIWFILPRNILTLLRLAIAILPAWYWLSPAMQKAVKHLQQQAKWFPFVHFGGFAVLGMIITGYLFPYFGGIQAIKGLSFLGVIATVFAGLFLLFAVVKDKWIRNDLESYRHYWFAFDANIRSLLESKFLSELPKTDFQTREKLMKGMRLTHVPMVYMVNAALGFLLYPMYFMGKYDGFFY